ncbi:hypothetical protein A9996_13010 [Gelidibacter algens]|nr:hypothetical protein A9996_13010 [Gelidibacter algens]
MLIYKGTEIKFMILKYQIPNTKYQIPNTKYQISKTKYQKPHNHKQKTCQCYLGMDKQET